MPPGGTPAASTGGESSSSPRRSPRSRPPSEPESLSRQHDLGWREPNIQVWNVNARGDRSLTLRHIRHSDRPLDNSAEEVVKHVARLWGFRVRLESVDGHDRVMQHWEVTPPQHH